MSVETSLKWSVQNGELDKVKAAADVPGFDINATDSMDRQLIHYAADYGQVDILRFLIDEKNANVNVVDKHGNTPMISAAFEGHIDCVDLLLKKGADKDIKGPGGLKALQAAQEADVDPEAKEAMIKLLK